MSQRPEEIRVVATPGTHIWRKPPDFDFDNAPRHLLPPQPFSAFSRARVTMSADWRARRDNIGLLLRFTHPAHRHRPARYVRVGAEIFKELNHDEVHVSVVATNTSSDWSLHRRDDDDEGGEETTVEVRVERDPVGDSLFLYYLSMEADGRVKARRAVREVQWMFEEEGLLVEVGVYASTVATQAPTGKQELVARFRGLVVDTV